MTETISPEREAKIQKLKELYALEKELKQRRYKKSLFEFNRDILGWPDIYEPLHRRVCDFIQDNIKHKKILLLLPRGCFKSSIVTIGYTLWRIAQDSSQRGLIANATYPMATGFLSQVKDHLQKNKAFMDLYGDLATDAPVWREDAISVNTEESFKSKEPTVTALGVGSNYTGLHFNYALLDDLVNRDNIGTMDRINDVIDFYKDVIDLVDPDENGHKQIILIGTCWHMADLYSWIQDKDTGILHEFAILKLPAFGEFDESDRFVGEWGTSELLFPTRLTWKVLESNKANQQSSHFSAQYLLDPVPSTDAVFKRFKYYDPTELTHYRLNTFISVDPALSEKKEGDFSAIVAVSVDYNNVWYIREIWRGKVNPKGLMDQIFYFDHKYRPITTAIETAAFQKILRFFIEDEMRKRNRFIPIKELSRNDQSKDQRIRSLEPRYNVGTVLHNRSDPFNKYLEDELSRFPRSKNDDIADALASINEIAFPPKKVEMRTERKQTNKWYTA